MPIFDHSRAVLCDSKESNADLIFVNEKVEKNFIEEYFNNCLSKSKDLILVLKDKLHLLNLDIPERLYGKVSICYEMKLKKGIEFAVVHTKNKNLYESLFEQNWFVPVSSFVQVAAYKNLELPTQSDFSNNLKRMFLSEETPHEIKEENVFFAPGATNILESIAKIMLKPGD